jgi:hypothetical protein
MTSMRHVAQTAYWYGIWGGNHARWGGVYAAFDRAVDHGMIRREVGERRNSWVYYPVEEED